MTNPKALYFRDGQERAVFNLPPCPRETLKCHLEDIRKREDLTQVPVIQSAAAEPDRLRLMFAVCQHGQLGQLFPVDTISPYPLERLEAGARFPRGGVLVLHGQHDSVAPVEECYRLKSEIEEVDPMNFRLVLRDGEHGFDHSSKLRDAWL